VAALEAHLDGVKAAYALNADKLDYNYRVLGALRVCGVRLDCHGQWGALRYR